jgi:hypothetical protein
VRTTAPPTDPAGPPITDRFGTTRGARLLGRVAAAGVPVLMAASFVWALPQVVLFAAAFTYLLGVPASYPLEALARRRPGGLPPTALHALAGALLGAPLGAWLTGGIGGVSAIAGLTLITAGLGAVAAALASAAGPRIRGRWRWWRSDPCAA